MENLNPLLIFTRVVDTGSFSNAARELGMSRSGVSKQISHLEERLKARLFVRTTRAISLTEVGKLVYEGALRVNNELRLVYDVVEDYHGHVRGTLKLAAPKNFGRLHVAPHIPEFLATYPELDVVLTLDDMQVDIIQGGFDLAFRIGDLKDSGLIVKHISENPMLLVASPAYIEKFGAPQSIEDLSEHNCLCYYTASHTFNNWVYRENGDVKEIRAAGNFEINDAESVLEAVKEGAGITLATHYIAYKSVLGGGLVRLLPDVEFLPSKPISMLYPERDLIPPKTRKFIDFILEKIGEKPYWSL